MYTIEVNNSMEITSHRLVESNLDMSSKTLLDQTNLSSKKKYISYLVEWILDAFKKGVVGFNQLNPSRSKISLFLFWKILYDATSLSEATTNKFATYLEKIIAAKWGLVSISYIKMGIDSTDMIVDTDYVDAGAAISLCFACNKVKPLDKCIYMDIFKDKIVFKSRLGLKLNPDFIDTVLSTKGDYPFAINSENFILNESVLDKNNQVFANLNKEGDISSDISLFPIDLSVLKIKSAKTRNSIKSILLNSDLKFKHHLIGLESIKDMTTYSYSHTAEIEIYDKITGEYTDTIYLIDNVVYFKSMFVCTDIGDIFADVGEEYAGEMMYDRFESFFYYKLKQRNISDLFVKAEGLQFKLELFFATE